MQSYKKRGQRKLYSSVLTLEKLESPEITDIVLASTERAKYMDSYNTVQKQIADTKITMSQSADRVIIYAVNIAYRKIKGLRYE